MPGQPGHAALATYQNYEACTYAFIYVLTDCIFFLILEGSFVVHDYGMGSILTFSENVFATTIILDSLCYYMSRLTICKGACINN